MASRVHSIQSGYILQAVNLLRLSKQIIEDLPKGIHDGLCQSDDPWALEEWPMPTAEAKGLLGLTP